MPTNSPNMQLPIPTVGATAGPLYASDVNDSLNLIDQHDHSSGRGVAITPGGLNINADLTFQGNNATHLLSVIFDQNASNSTLQSLYVAPGGESPTVYDLFYTDSAGNPIQITKDGLVNSTIGSLPGQSYAAGTFIWKQGTGSTTPADFDIGSITLRPNTAATTFGVTLSPPTSIASAYTLFLPADPGVLPSGSVGDAFMTLDTAGQMAGSVSTTGGITSSMLAAGIATGSTTVTSGPFVIPATVTSVFYNAASGTIATSLPTPVGIGGKVYKLKKIDNTLNAVTITSAAGSIFSDGTNSFTPTLNTPGEEWELTSDGANWQVTNHKTKTQPSLLTLSIPNSAWTTPTNTNGFSYRDGKNLVFFGSFTGTGPNAGTVTFPFGFAGTSSNVSIDTTVVPGTTRLPIGIWGTANGLSQQGGSVFIAPTSSSTNIFFASTLASNTVDFITATTGQVGGNGSLISFSCVIPISGWFA